ncbi:CoA-binding protein [Candidatus Gracilibacteria bacterium]|nr:CoA-binding protein [Candidatus Gracilibacteria bacterium]NJM88775.1 CoA-binding protein [Hydrococcus sp. RU_2_2]NJP20731.1 CoA-binding protein [Hydrococcus sp. CRU_1_1]NJQ97043.1 CoA-binding protein [Hydrococcus sp. CSU_1_8]
MINLTPSSIPDDKTLRDILSNAKTIAVVGHSDKPFRTSYQIAQFLRSVGYRVYPVNPAVVEIDGQSSYPTLKDLPEAIDLVNVFRRSEYLNEVVEEAILTNAKTIWAQLGVRDRQAAQNAIDAGLNIVMDTCIKVEYLRLKINSSS